MRAAENKGELDSTKETYCKAQTVQNRPPQVRNKKFTSSEDERIIQFVAGNGGSCTQVQWLSLDEELGRKNLSAQLRWKNILKPRLRAVIAGKQLDSVINMPVSPDSHVHELVATVKYVRQPFTCQEDEQILRFACERSRQDPAIPWLRLDEQLGRTGGAGHHRYLTLMARAEQGKKRRSGVEHAPPSQRKRVARRHAGAPRISMTVLYQRVTDYTPEEDALIMATESGSRRQKTTAQWKALAAQMARPVSWLRYRWAILTKKEEEAKQLDRVEVVEDPPPISTVTSTSCDPPDSSLVQVAEIIMQICRGADESPDQKAAKVSPLTLSLVRVSDVGQVKQRNKRK